MKIILHLFCIAFFASHVNAQSFNGSAAEQQSLDNATAAIRDAFAKGDGAWLPDYIIPVLPVLPAGYP